MKENEKAKPSSSWDGFERRGGPESARRTVQLERDLQATVGELSLKTERLSALMTSEDMEALRAAARAEGIPLASLVVSVLRKYSQHRLVDIDQARILLGIAKEGE